MANSNSFGKLCSLRRVGAPDTAGADASRCIFIDESAVSSGRRKGGVAIDDVAEAVDRIRRRGLHIRTKRLGRRAGSAEAIGLGGERRPARRGGADNIGKGIVMLKL